MIVRQVLVRLDSNGDWHRPAPGHEPQSIADRMFEGATAARPATVRTLCGLEGRMVEASWESWSEDSGVRFPMAGEIRCPACAV